MPSDHNTTRIFEGPREKNFQKKKIGGRGPTGPPIWRLLTDNMLRACDNSGDNNNCSEICGGCSDVDGEGEDDGNGLVTVVMVAGQRQ